MTATLATLEAQCNALNGYRGTPGNDNINKIWAELYPPFQGASYCAAGVSYIWRHAGGGFPAIDHPFGFTYCPDGVDYAQAHGLWDASGHYTPGDTVFYSWDGSGVAEHTEILLADNGSVMHTFGCNTGSGNVSDGEGCFFNDRPHSSLVLGVLKSSLFLAPNQKPGPDLHPAVVTKLWPWRSNLIRLAGKVYARRLTNGTVDCAVWVPNPDALTVEISRQAAAGHSTEVVNLIDNGHNEAQVAHLVGMEPNKTWA